MYTYKGYSEADGRMVDTPPEYGSEGAAAVDLRTTACLRCKPGQVTPTRTGLRMAMPPGMAALIIPRSGLGSRGLVLANGVGLIDSDYRGEVIVNLHNRTDTLIEVREGDRVAQMMFVPYWQVELVKVDSLSDTARGEGGFGSTGGTS